MLTDGSLVSLLAILFILALVAWMITRVDRKSTTPAEAGGLKE